MARKKVSKLRGSKTHGWGTKKKHRGAGSKGGRGNAGSKKQKKTWFLKYDPKHIGKYGFTSVKKKCSSRSVRVGSLESLAGGKKDIDVGKLGYAKVVGGGSISSKLTVKAPAFTRSAAESIEKAGGKVDGVVAGADDKA